MIIPNHILPTAQALGATGDDPTAAYLTRVAADGGVVAGANCLINEINKLKIPNNMGANAFDSASLVFNAAGGYKAGKLFCLKPHTGAGDLDVTRATPAFRTNASGVSESVASGVPRLDYPAAGGCPALLVEPAATNLLLRSEELNDASWTKAGCTVNANATVAPNGTTTADMVSLSIVSGEHACVQFGRWPASTQATASFYVKANTANRVYIANATPGNGAFFNLSNGTVEGLIGAFTATITLVNDGYYRITATHTASASQTFAIGIYETFTGNYTSTTNFTPASANSVFLWGAQLETGSVATSYIPTTSAAVTRNADVISKTGVSGFIGQSVGTLYAEVDVRNFQADGRILAISNGTSDNRIALLKGANSTLRGLVTTASGSVADIATASGRTAGVYKIAFAYATDDFILYVNGSQIGTDTSGAVPACTDVYVGKIETSATTNQLNDRIRAAAIYTTRLSNTELAALTSL
jgi:hypothetical protein